MRPIIVAFVVVFLSFSSAAVAGIRCPLPRFSKSPQRVRCPLPPGATVTLPGRLAQRRAVGIPAKEPVVVGTPAAACPDGQCPTPGSPARWQPFGGRFRMR